MNGLGQDVTYAVRMFCRSKTLAVTCVLSLAIGIGSSTSTYQSIRDFYFADIPAVGDAAGLVRTAAPVSYQEFEAFRDRSGAFSDAAAYMAPVAFLVTVNERIERVYGHLVTANYFDVLKAGVSSGGFRTAASHRNSAPEVIVSRRFWQSHLHASPAAIGRPIRINHEPVMLVGVAAPDFLGASPLLEPADLWIPVTAAAAIAPELARAPLDDPGSITFQVVGRLKPGITQASAEATLDRVTGQIAQSPVTPARPGRRVALVPGGRVIPLGPRDRVAASAFPAVLIGLLLWVACSNVANLLLARAAARRREIALRLALGATRGRVVRQLLIESTLLSVAGGLAGLVLVWWSSATLNWFQPVLPEYMNLQVSNDWGVLAFSAGISVLTGVLFGLAPALHATRSDITLGLKAPEGAAIPGFRWFSTRNMIVLQQLAASLMLLLLTGFILVGVFRSAAPDIGFNPHRLYRMSLDPVREGYGVRQVQGFFTHLRERLEQEPGVERVALALSAPLEPFSRSAATSVRLPDRPDTGDTDDPAGAQVSSRVSTDRVGASFFEIAQVRLLQGRTFAETDERERTTVAVINEHFARELYPRDSAVGHVLELDGQRVDIIGVVQEIRSNALFSVPHRRAYLPLRPADLATPGPKGVTLLVRMAPGVAVDAMIRRVVGGLDRSLTVFDLRSMDDRVGELMGFVRLTLYVYGAIGVFSLVLAAIGLTGVTAYAVAQRRREIGVRIALGAPREDILRLVMREGMWIVAAGTALGVACGYAMLRLLRGVLDVLAQVTAASASDPALLIGAPLVLAALAMIACYLPARRAVRIEPATALRDE